MAMKAFGILLTATVAFASPNESRRQLQEGPCADLDGDGFPDIIVANRDQEDQIFLTTENGNKPFDHESLPTAVSTTFGPFNTEKDPEIYAKDPYGEEEAMRRLFLGEF